MRIIDLDTVTDGNPSGRRISKDLFLYHGTWHDEDAHSFRLDTLYICFVEKGEHSFVLNSQHYTVRAGELLICHPYYSVKEIASHLGFSNFSFFCKSVKKFFGMTPLELRNSPLGR